MTKKEFLKSLEEQLDFLKKEDREDVLRYYDEMIQDALENGQSEEAFVATLLPISAIITSIREDRDFVEKVRTQISPEAKHAISLAAKIVGYVIFVLAAIAVVGGAISFISSGGLIIFLAVVDLIENPTTEAMVWVTRIGQLLLGSGLIVLAISFLIAFFTYARRGLSKLLAKLQTVLK